MKRLAAVGLVLAIVVVAVGSATVVPLLKRKVQGASGALVGWDMSDDVVGAPQFEGRGRALVISRFHRGQEQFYRTGALDLATGEVLAHKVLDDRGVQYYGQSDQLAWMRGTGEDLHARGPDGEVVIGEKALLAKNPQIPGGGLLHHVDDGAFVDAATGGLFLPSGGHGVIIDPASFGATAATEARVKRQHVGGALPVAKLSTGEMLTTSHTAGGSWLAVGGKQIVKDQRMYSTKYLTITRTGTLIELDAPRSILVLYNDWDNANPRVLVSRVSLDGRVLWTTPVRNTRTLRREQLKVISSGLSRGRLVLVIDDHYKTRYQPPVFTPFYAMAIDVESGQVAWTTPL